MASAMPDARLAAPPGFVLAFDTASNDGSVAVLRGDAVLTDHAWTIASTPSEELLAAVDAALGRAGVARTDLEGMAVVTGPGGYSGLRAGVATAQGLAFGLDIPLAGIGRLDAEAARHLGPDAATIVAVHDAGRSGIAWSAFQTDTTGDVTATVAPRLDAPEVVAVEAPQARWCGDLTERLRLALTAAGRDAELASGDTTSADDPPSRAVSAARLARRRAAYGDPAAVDVVYLRPPPITRPRA
jgi:tRNA threonylcarbamoyladenosine biosynthesis protein TsaB